MNQKELNHYFEHDWNCPIEIYKYSGLSIADKIKDHEWVIDVGCGTNPFKGKIKNLIGVDPAFDQADYRVEIENFKTDRKFDVALCLGSINFHSKDIVINQIKIVNGLLNDNARIYWRTNPGYFDHNNEECKKITFYNWSIEDHYEFSSLFGFKCNTIEIDAKQRIYAEWIR